MASEMLWDEKGFVSKLEDDVAVLEELHKSPKSDALNSIIKVLGASVMERIELIALIHA